ncbi:hypothetical protein QMM61_07930, partial [Leptospira santarosai]|nr:hypothetical protein [Leptospira santarosai]
MIERKFRVNLSEPVPKKLNEVALYESLIFALQRAFDYAPLSTAISLSMDRSSLLCKEPSITLRYLRLSRSLWIAHLCFAKS